MRKLASIQKILALTPIEGADKIVKATVLGWDVVVRKDEFAINDLVVYVEVDSILPDRKEFDFMRERKFRVKTIKLKGQVSQGICFPISILPKGKWNEDDDVTEVIGVTKYESSCERQERLRDEVKSNRIKKFMMRYNWFRSMFVRPSKKPFPSFIRKTDEDRIQLFPRICEEHKDTYFSVTEKLDGQSGTYFMLKSNRKWYEFWIPKFVFGVCSRNFHLVKEDNSTWWTIYRQVDMKSALQFLFDGMKAYSHVVIQGEIIGEGIQGNKYGIKGIDFYLFNIYIDGELMDNEDMFAIDWNIKNVPFLYNLFRLEPTIQQSVEKAKGESQIADTIREGIVVRNYEKNISFKIINPDFLLKWDL